MSPHRSIQVGNRRIGPGAPCFVAAEVGLNHNGRFDLALASVEAAAAAGADGVKFQNYRTEDFLSDKALTYTYVSNGRTVVESQWDMFKRFEPPSDWWLPLKRRCEELGVVFFSTPTSKDRVDELVRLGVGLLKNGSDYLTNVELLEYMGSTGIPVIVSTGMADHEDVSDAVAAVQRGAASPVLLLHCTTAYPTPPGQTNLRRIDTLRAQFDVLVGFSDHTEGTEAAAQAVAHGACFIEKHFTLDRTLSGPDHPFSATPEELRELVESVRRAAEREGSGDLVPAGIETAARADYRLSVVAVTALKPGTPLTRDDVAFRRPGIGMLPKDLSRYIGRRLARAVGAGEPLVADDFV